MNRIVRLMRFPAVVVVLQQAAFSEASQVQNYNEIQIIESFDLLRKVVDKIDCGVSYYIAGRLNDKEVFTNIPFKINVINVNSSLYETEIKFNYIDKYHFKISYLKDKKPITLNGTFGDYVINSDLKLEVLNLKPIAAVTSNYYIKIHNLNQMVNNIQKNLLNIDVPDKTNVLQITLKDPNPQRGVAFMDTLINMYVRNVVDHEIKVNTRTIEFVNKLLNDELGIMDTISLSMQKYEANKNILDLDKEEDEEFSQYSILDANRTTLEAQVSALNDLEKYIIEDKDPQFFPPSVYINSDDDFLKSATDELYNMQISKIDELAKGTKESMVLSDMDVKIDSIKQEILRLYK